MGEQSLPRRGDLLSDRYLLINLLAQGGMATVWRARDGHLGREVAVKVLDHRLAGDPNSIARLHIEAQALARLSHPHIATVHDYGITVGEPAVTYLVMELVQGVPVADVCGRLTLPTAAAVLAQVADALAFAHERGIVHRDVTASNVLLTASGAKLIDFGICAVDGDNDTADDGKLLGTVAYLAPERLDGKPVSPAVDVYAFGVLAYLMLAGRMPAPPSALSDQDELAVRHRPQPESLDALDIPADIGSICLRCMADDPRSRPTAQEVGDVLRSFVVPGEKSWTAVLAAAQSAPATPVTFTGPTEVKRLRRQHRSKRGRRRSAAGVAAAVGAFTSVVWLLTNWTPVPGEHPQALVPADPPAPSPASIGCQVTYEVSAQSGGRFTAGVTVTNHDSVQVPAGWWLRLALPDSQQLNASQPGPWRQDGTSVTSNPIAEPLPPQQSVQLTIHATAAAAQPPPTQFWLNGRLCAATVVSPGAGQPAAANVIPAGKPSDDDAEPSGKGPNNNRPGEAARPNRPGSAKK